MTWPKVRSHNSAQFRVQCFFWLFSIFIMINNRNHLYFFNLAGDMAQSQKVGKYFSNEFIIICARPDFFMRHVLLSGYCDKVESRKKWLMSTLKWHKSLLKLELKAVWYVTVLDRVLARSGSQNMFYLHWRTWVKNCELKYLFHNLLKLYNNNVR